MISRLREVGGHKNLVVPLITLAVALLTIGLRALGGMEGLELTAYDWCMALRPAQTTSPRVTLIGITEEDISALGSWPLPDATLAQALTKIVEHQPLAIGVDLYRNLPVPPGSTELEQVVLGNPQIVMIKKFGDLSSPGVPLPAFLKEDSPQTGFSDLVIDAGGVVRRGLLFLDDGTTVSQSLALRLATMYLADQGIIPQPDPLIPAHIRLGQTTIHPLRARDGGYAELDAAGYQFLLDFRDQTWALPIFSLADLSVGRIDDAALRGRVVILGTMAASQHDSFFLPARLGGEADGLVHGMTVHAHATSQLIRCAVDGAHPITPLPKMFDSGWIICCCLLGGGIGLWARSLFLWSFIVATGVIMIVVMAVMALSLGWWLTMVPPVLGLLMAAGLTTAYLSYEEGKSRVFLMDIFSRHVSKAVANSLWLQRRQFMNNGRPVPQRLTATVLFTDLVAFTAIAEQLDPPELMAWLNRYMEVMGREIMAHGGIINKYIGDSMMAIFGAPVARLSEVDIKQDAVNAVQCAISMRVALRELNRQWMAQGMMPVGTRIGIFTGPLVAGSLGGADRLEYTVLGDTVNIASRLESFAKETFLFHPLDHPCRILLGDATRTHLGESSVQSLPDSVQYPLDRSGAGILTTRLIGDIRLRGKDTPVSIYELL